MVGNGTTNPWDTSSAIWQSNGAATAFAAGDNTLFADGGSFLPQVNLASNVVAGAVTVASAQSYSFGGAGALSAGPLVKSGPGSLTLANTGANSFASIALDDGALSLPNATAGGTATITLSSGTLAFSPPANSTISNAFVIDGEATISVTTQHYHSAAWTGMGTLNVIATAMWSLKGDTSAFAGRVSFGASASNVRLYGSLGSALAEWDLGTGTGKLFNRDGGGSFSLGSLEGGANTQLLGAASTDAASTYSIGARREDTTFDGSIKDGTAGANAKVNLTKIGGGTLTLTGVNTYTGTTTISAGSLAVEGTLAATAMTIASSGTPTLDAIAAVTLYDYQQLRFADRPWLPATPQLRALSEAWNARPSFARTKPYIAS